MTGILALLCTDGQEVDAEALGRRAAALAERGGDAAGVWIDGPVGLAAAVRWNVPEAIGQQQPVHDREAGLVLVFDGRLDQREALINLLTAHGHPPRDATDAALVLCAHRVWGAAMPARLSGDFAFVLWDGHRRRLLAARDILGVRPLVYQQHGGIFCCASSLSALLPPGSVMPPPNEGLVGEYLAAAVRDRGETVYQGVYRLPPAHLLVVEDGRLRLHRYWHGVPGERLRYRYDRDYGDHLRELLAAAVRDRLRTAGPAGAYLSGGLDSSSVVSVVRWLGDDATAALSVRFPSHPSDESPYIDAVLARWPGAAQSFAAAAPDAERLRGYAAAWRDLPPPPNHLIRDELRRWAQQQGLGVLLTGEGGDEWFGGSAYRYTDFLAAADLAGLVRQMRRDLRTLPDGPTPRQWLRAGLRPLLHDLAPPALRPHLHRPGYRPPPAFSPLLNADFARRVDLAARLHPPEVTRPARLPRPHYLHDDVLCTGASGWRTLALEIEDRIDAAWGMEARHPLLDRRVVEFALTLPEEQRWRGEGGRFVLRQALHGILPELVRTRRDKADFSHSVPLMLRAMDSQALLQRPRIAELGWVNLDRLRAAHDDLLRRYDAGDNGYLGLLWYVWMPMSVELWWRAVYG